jgi:hypothetical protein
LNLVKKLILLGAVLAPLTGVVWAAVPASAAPVYAKNGTYQFASNYTDGSSNPFMVSNSPFSYSDASQSLGAGGVTISAKGTEYASSGVIVDLGPLSSLFSGGQYVPPTVTGTGVNFPKVVYNLYFDTNDDQTYFGWGSHDPYSYTGMDGDNAAAMGAVNNGDPSTNDNADFGNFSGQGSTPGGPALTSQMPMEAVQQAFANRTDGGTKDPEVWAWIGVQTAPDQTATITSVNGKNLVSTYAAPVTGLKVTPRYTTLSATWHASNGATGGYQVTVTSHQAVVTKATVTGTSYHLGHLKQKTSYGVHVLALPQAPGQKATTAYVSTK